MRKPVLVLSHWYVLIEGLRTSTRDFYATFKTAVSQRSVPDGTLSRVDWRESGILSARREYLRVGRGHLAFDICAAPFGNGFFFSWWLTETATPYAALIGLVLLLGAPLTVVASMNLLGPILGPIIGIGVVLIVLLMIGSSVVEDAILALPILGWIYKRLFHPETFYHFDTALMFQETIRLTVLEVIDGLTNAQGLRSLRPEEREPRLKALLR